MLKKVSLFIVFTLIVTLFIPSLALASEPLETFSPWKGESNTFIDPTINKRESYQLMYWRSGSLTEFGALNDTYEHETVFYNYDGTAWATTATSYTINLPDPYLDTQALDGNKEYNIAIGTFDPTDITSSTWYDYTVILDTTGSTSSYYKINGQEGYSLCETGAWCVENGTTFRLIPFKSPFKAPEMNRDFMFEWESNNTTSAADVIALGDWGSGVINSTSDVDYWSFYLSSSRTVNFILKQATSSVDYELEIYDSSGNYKGGSHKGTGEDETCSISLSSGTYYIKVFPYGTTIDQYFSYSVIPY